MCKKNGRFLRTVLTFLLPFCFCACSNNIDSMIEDYNGHFVPDESLNNFTVDNIVAEEMLAPDYPVPYRTTLCLTAPAGATSYSWVAVIGENANGIEKGLKYNLGSARNLTLYLPYSNLKQWSHYSLTLTVQKPDGTYLADTANLYIY